MEIASWVMSDHTDHAARSHHIVLGVELDRHTGEVVIEHADTRHGAEARSFLVVDIGYILAECSQAGHHMRVQVGVRSRLAGCIDRIVVDGRNLGLGSHPDCRSRMGQTLLMTRLL